MEPEPPGRPSSHAPGANAPPQRSPLNGDAASDELSRQLFIDIDGYFKTMVDSPPIRASAPERFVTDLEFVRLTSHVHYLLRSALVVPLNAVDAEGAISAWSKRLVPTSLGYAAALAGGVELPPPDWAQVYSDFVKDAYRQAHPLVDEVTLRVTVEPRMQCRSLPHRRTVEVSAVTRELLRTVNLIIWSLVEAVQDGTTNPDESPLLELLLPYLLATYFDTDLSRLPMVRGYNLAAIEQAVYGARVQVSLMLAHEYGHLLLHKVASPPSEALELQADDFARESMLDADFRAYDLVIASRWLFKYMQLDRIVGAMLCGRPPDFVQEELASREWAFITPMISAKGGREQTLRSAAPDPAATLGPETIGTYALLKAKGDLYNLGPAGLQQLARSFESDYCLSGRLSALHNSNNS